LTSFPSLYALAFITVQLMRHQRAVLPLKLDGLAAAREFFSGCFADADTGRESLWVAHLDDQARCLHLTRHEGDDAGTDFPLRSIIADAALHGSSGIVLAHNHPSGDPTPSDADKRATRRLACAAEALDCTLVDHLVFGGARSTSFREMGLL
jgi:DNA repair protein RadC